MPPPCVVVFPPAVVYVFAQGRGHREIRILVQRAVAGRPILEALKQAGIPAKSYYEESQLDSEAAQERFATFKLLLNKEDRVALRYLLGAGDDDFRRKAYARVRAHCEASGDSPWTAMQKLADELLTLPHTKPLVERFRAIRAELDVNQH